MKKRFLLPILLFFLYLLSYPQIALTSARDGLLLWYHSVLPILFPFMLLCSVTLHLGLLDALPGFIYKPIQILFGCSGYGAFAVLAGFLCGFPMGAKLTFDLREQNKISHREAYFLYGFVNNLSPGFILSYLAANQLGASSVGILFLINILGSAALYGILTSFSFRRSRTADNPGTQSDAFRTNDQNLFEIIDNCIYDSIRNIVKLGAYIVLFSMISGALTKLLPMSGLPSLLAVSCVEVTNGIHLIAESPLDFSTKYILLSALGTFGGLSALAQTAGISHMNKKLFLHYIKSRVSATLLSILISVCSVLLSVFVL